MCGGEIAVVMIVVAVVTLVVGGGGCASRCGGKRHGQRVTPPAEVSSLVSSES